MSVLRLFVGHLILGVREKQKKKFADMLQQQQKQHELQMQQLREQHELQLQQLQEQVNLLKQQPQQQQQQQQDSVPYRQNSGGRSRARWALQRGGRMTYSWRGPERRKRPGRK
ncbi:ataxin-8-like [Pogonomyrmex barbatus]|uniref:Ataxin-8-like n=1 Tax=Pogonomyrmex barbatus TaxID=144034 RepID=A0A6I9WV01_9HYME|nr:ataxin-8-like [Pogonomyrmex barbatus]